MGFSLGILNYEGYSLYFLNIGLIPLCLLIFDTLVEYIGKGGIVVIPETIEDKPVVAIANEAFMGLDFEKIDLYREK